MEKKDRDQCRAEVVALKNKHLVITLPTGMGKTRTALETAFSSGPLFPKVLIVYYQNVSEGNWKDEIVRWGYDRDMSLFTFTTYASLHKHAGEHWDVVICDEGHHITERVMDIMENMSFTRALILSATLTGQQITKLRYLLHDLYVYKVRMKDAINSDILPDPHIVLWPLMLKTMGNTETIILNPKVTAPVVELTFAQRKMFKDRKHKYVIPCTETQYYLDLETKVDFFKRAAMGSAAMKNLWLQKAGVRLKWLASKKSPYVKQLLSLLNEERTLTFCGSIEQTKELGENCIHSKNKNSQQILKDFNDGKIDHITAVAMLDECVNLTSCRVGIFANISSSERIQIQRVGRILRHPSPIIFIPYFKNSREEEVVKKMLEGYNPERIMEITDLSSFTLPE